MSSIHVSAGCRDEGVLGVRQAFAPPSFLSASRSAVRDVADIGCVCHLAQKRDKEHPVNSKGISDLGQQTITPYFTVKGADRPDELFGHSVWCSNSQGKQV